jgi:hypothetical protein
MLPVAEVAIVRCFIGSERLTGKFLHLYDMASRSEVRHRFPRALGAHAIELVIS